MNNKGTMYSMRNRMIGGVDTHKIGYTQRHVRERLKEANSETYTPPEWEVEVAKEVDNVIESEKQVHSLLTILGMRMYPTYPRKEFFNVPFATIKGILDLIPGTYYTLNDQLPSTRDNTEVESEGVEEVEEVESEEVESEEGGEGIQENRTNKRDMREYIQDGTHIRHRLNNSDEWIGVYNRNDNLIIRGDVSYFTPTAFADAHGVEVLGNNKNKRSGWSECFIQLTNGESKKLNKLEKL